MLYHELKQTFECKTITSISLEKLLPYAFFYFLFLIQNLKKKIVSSHMHLIKDRDSQTLIYYNLHVSYTSFAGNRNDDFADIGYRLEV